MKKPAETAFPVNEHIKQRWSPISFSEQPMTLQQLGSLLEAVRWAPSCYNEQPWHFIVGFKGTSGHERLNSCLVPANAAWASKAPLLMLSVARTFFERNGKPNAYAHHDVGLAVGQMVIQATSMGLAVHQMGGYDKQKARDRLEIPDGFEPLAMIAIGYQGDSDTLPDDLKARELASRMRRELASICSEGIWGTGVNLTLG